MTQEKVVVHIGSHERARATENDDTTPKNLSIPNLSPKGRDGEKSRSPKPCSPLTPPELP